jgi:hypothetical protein
MHGMHTAYTDTELQTVSGFLDDQQPADNILFNQQIKKYGAPYAWEKFSTQAKTHSIKELHAEYQYTEQPYLHHLTSNQQGAFCITYIAEDWRKRIILDDVLDGNKDAYQKFTESPYAYTLIDLAYAQEGAKKNPIDWLTPHDRYAASKKLKNVCIKLNNAIKKQQSCKLSLHDEYILQTEMPESVAQKIQNTNVLCQLPYKERIWPVIKQSASAATCGAFLGTLGGITLDVGGLVSDKLKYVQDYSNIIQHAPLPIRYLAGHSICMLFPAYLPPLSNVINLDETIRLTCDAAAFFFMTLSMHDYYKKKDISLITDWHGVISTQLIGGAIGAVVWCIYALGKMSDRCIQKTIKDIKQLPSNN